MDPGESAGSISIAYHMCSTVPHLFHRAILQSGTASYMSPLSLETYDKSYRKLLKLLDIPLDLPREDRLQRLRTVPVEKFIESYQFLDNGYPAFPGVEGWFWREKVDGRTGGMVMAGCDWVNEIIIGDCLVEVGSLFPISPLSRLGHLSLFRDVGEFLFVSVLIAVFVRIHPSSSPFISISSPFIRISSPCKILTAFAREKSFKLTSQQIVPTLLPPLSTPPKP